MFIKMNNLIKAITKFKDKKLKKIYFGENVCISNTAIFRTTNSGEISIGDHCSILDHVIFDTYGGSIKIGNNCSFNPFCVIYGHGGLVIGDNVRIATQTVIIPANHIYHNVNVPIMNQGETKIGIRIEDDVWIGAGVKILDGVIVGKGSVIGAGSVVTKSIPPYSVVVGVPAKIKSKREKNVFCE